MVFCHPFEKYAGPSNWIISPGIGVKIPKMFELPPPRISYLLSYGFVRNLFLVIMSGRFVSFQKICAF